MLTRLRSLFVALILVIMGAMPVCAQTIQAKGKVIDSEGKALAGVSVSAKQDKALHTTTASDGTFSIQVAEKTILVFTLTGKQTVELVATTTPMQVTLPNAAPEKKETTTVVSMRQATSVKSVYYPLWVIDGVIYKEDKDFNVADLASPEAKRLIAAALPGLSESDIQSFQVINDASATALYGQRALGGVISVRTSKAGQGTNSFTYQAELTYRAIPSYREYNILNSQDQMAVFNEMANGKSLDNEAVFIASQYGVYGHLYNSIYNYNDQSGEYGVLNTDAGRAAYLRAAELRNTNWFKELFSPSIMQTHSVSMSGGTSKSNYYASASALIDPGWYKQSQVKRYTANLNVTHHLLKSLSLNVIGGASYRNQRAPGTLGQDVDVVGGEVKRDFDINPYSYATNTSRVLDPREYYTANYAPFNIFNELENNYIDLDVLDAKFQAELRFKPIRGLELTLLGAFKHTAASQQHNVRDNSNQALAYRAMPNSVIRESNKYLYRDPDHPYDLPSTVLPNGGFMHKGENRMSNYDFRATANYNRTFGVHTLNLFGGLETTNIQRNRTAFTGWGLQYAAGETPFYPYQYFKKQVEDGNSYYNLNNTNYRTVAFYGNATYSYKGRYVVNGTYRYEGSNQLGRSSNARWMSTWNVSGAWNMHEEDFFQKLKPLSHLTLRLSYSLTGTPPDPSYSSSTTILKSYIPFRLFAEDQEPGIGIEQLGNADLTYEKKNELNAGFDAGLFDDRLSLSFDAYTRRNFDEMGPMITQGIGGTIIRPANVAEMMSSGLELSITSQNIKTKDFNWTTSFIYSYTHSEITKLYNQGRMIDLVSGNGFAKKGYPARALFSIPFVGLNNQGLPQLINEKGEVTTDNINFQERNHTEYLKYEGPTDPTHTGSLGNTLSYKGLHLNVFLTYAFGNVVRLDPKFKAYYGDMASMTHAFINRWQAAGEEARTDIPTILSRRQYATNNNLRYAYNGYNYSTARIAKGDFIRLKEISLAYDLPTSLIKRTPLRSASVKVQATNLFLLYADKKLNGQDPEFFNIGGVASPTPRQFTLTLKLGL
uniref:TonB-linked outer membrane protein, SusC/RagA family n=1 Tax=Siphoviridae sp. ctJ0s2 TaxID=2827834 RepID=A0A8S5TE23_9CAUD|nr:MAG TPA: TonB-linked outer membrane protein, SusC/RagA family [Siphoviridae sp. ctJ0s2]